MKKMLFIYNPKAGKAQIRNKLADILDVFTKGGYEITVYPTQRSEDAMEKTEKRSKEYDIVVCSGGDGTLDEVVTGMIRSGLRLLAISRPGAPMISEEASGCRRIW
jgi:diacylglycerol kinase (ATP)